MKTKVLINKQMLRNRPEDQEGLIDKQMLRSRQED